MGDSKNRACTSGSSTDWMKTTGRRKGSFSVGIPNSILCNTVKERGAGVGGGEGGAGVGGTGRRLLCCCRSEATACDKRPRGESFCCRSDSPSIFETAIKTPIKRQTLTAMKTYRKTESLPIDSRRLIHDVLLLELVRISPKYRRTVEATGTTHTEVENTATTFACANHVLAGASVTRRHRKPRVGARSSPISCGARGRGEVHETVWTTASFSRLIVRNEART